MYINFTWIIFKFWTFHFIVDPNHGRRGLNKEKEFTHLKKKTFKSYLVNFRSLKTGSMNPHPKPWKLWCKLFSCIIKLWPVLTVLRMSPDLYYPLETENLQLSSCSHMLKDKLGNPLHISQSEMICFVKIYFKKWFFFSHSNHLTDLWLKKSLLRYKIK